MGRDTITLTNSVRDGVAPALDTPSDANDAQFNNSGGNVIVVLISGLGGAAVGAGARTVTIQQAECSHGRTENAAAFVVANDSVAVFGPFPPLLYNQSDGTVQIDYAGLSTNQRVYAMGVL